VEGFVGGYKIDWMGLGMRVRGGGGGRIDPLASPGLSHNNMTDLIAYNMTEMITYILLSRFKSLKNGT
jgi:hypothetical protein